MFKIWVLKKAKTNYVQDMVPKSTKLKYSNKNKTNASGNGSPARPPARPSQAVPREEKRKGPY